LGIDGQSATILLVEDDREDQKLIQRALKKGRVRNQLFIVNDGEEALEFLHRRGNFCDPASAPRPDLILLDLNMPKIDGRAVLEQIKHDSQLKSIVVVVLTTSSQEEDILRSYDLGANSYLTKPVTMDGFIKTLQDLENYWLDIVILPPNNDTL
jgi:CheY-like chemotaxis protein